MPASYLLETVPVESRDRHDVYPNLSLGLLLVTFLQPSYLSVAESESLGLEVPISEPDSDNSSSRVKISLARDILP